VIGGRAELRKSLEQVLRGMVENGLVEAEAAASWAEYCDRDFLFFVINAMFKLTGDWQLKEIKEQMQLAEAA
jgi:hypothetical protein